LATITYAHEFSYLDSGDDYFPMLQFSLQASNHEAEAVDVDTFLDSGARYSLFDGAILAAIGLTLMDGPARVYQPVAGLRIEARVHRVRLAHERLGDFEFEIGFSTGAIKRNLLGRDFFNLIQVAFREHHLRFFIESTP
jgi:hypothetical protein